MRNMILGIVFAMMVSSAGAAENMLKDSGFEDGGAWHVWGTWGGFTANDKATLEQYPEQGAKSGKKCLKTSDVKNDHAPYIIQFIDNVQGGEQYILTFWAKSEKSCKGRAGLQTTGAGKYLGGSNEVIDLTDQWKQYTVIIPRTSKNTDRIGVMLAATGGDKAETGTAFFDDAVMVKATDEEVAEALKSILGKPEKDGLIFYAPMDGTADAKFAIARKNPVQAKDLTFVEGKKGQAVRIAGDAQLVYDGRNCNMEEGTVALWVKRDQKWSEKRSYILFKTTVGPAWNQNSLVLMVTEWNQLRVWIWNADKKQWLIMSPNQIEQAAQTWYHVAFTYQEGSVKIYINGKEISYGTPCDPMVEMPSGTSKTMGIGCDYTPKAVLNGEVDDLRIYNRPLSAAEIAELAK